MAEKAPDLHLDWEERLVGWMYRWWRRVKSRKTKTPDTSHHAHLSESEDTLRVLAQLFAGRALTVREAEGAGGIRGSLLLLPKTIGVAEDPAGNLELYRLRTVIDGTRIQLGAQAPTGHYWTDAVQTLVEAGRALNGLQVDFEGFARRFKRAAVRV